MFSMLLSDPVKGDHDPQVENCCHKFTFSLNLKGILTSFYISLIISRYLLFKQTYHRTYQLWEHRLSLKEKQSHRNVTGTYGYTAAFASMVHSDFNLGVSYYFSNIKRLWYHSYNLILLFSLTENFFNLFIIKIILLQKKIYKAI